MKISLAGPSYTSGSVNAAVQQTMNLVPEIIEVPNEPVKMVLYGRPGIKVFTTLSQPKIRALWAGGGRLFVVNGSNLSEVAENGTATDRTGSVAQGPNDPDPAQIFSNGHQLMIVSGGKVYCDNGAGPKPALFLVSGTGNLVNSTASLNWVSGPTFQTSWTGMNITINGQIYTISGVPGAGPTYTTLLLSPTPADASNVPWAISGGAQVDGQSGGFIDGYFVINRVPRPDLPQNQDPGRQFNISGLNDGTYWDPLMFGVKEGRSDYIQSVLCDHEEVILFGTESTEIWTNTGAAEFPFQRVPGAFIQDGSVAIYAPCSVGPTFCWLGGGPDGQTRAYRAEGLQPVRISTHAQEWAWNAPGFRVKDAVSFSYVNAGHLHWVVNFWQQQKSWVFDFNTQLWHERALWNAAGSNFLRYQAWYHTFIPEWGEGGKHIVANPESGKLYELSSNLFTDDNAAIQYQRAFPHLINENQYGYHHRLEVLMEMGALTAGQPVPLLGLDWSDDHGHTWKTNIGRLTPTAQAGDYTRRAVFRRLGKARDRVYRVGVTASTKVALIDTFLEATPGFA
jgi:hypothetical protein